MIKDVKIDITGIQESGEDSDKIEFTTDGRFGEKDGKYFLSYDEGQMFESANVRTKIFINPDNSVVLQRSGDINTRMEIREGERTSCFYSTAVGDICIGLYGEMIENKLNASGGSLKMIYTIDSSLQFISRNEVSINIKEVTECQY